MKPEKTLNDLADEVLGKRSSLRKVSTTEPYKLPNIQREKLADEFEAFFNEPSDNPLPAPSKPKAKQTLVVNLFAGPGTGKSTAAAGIFYDLKNLGINCELAAEYAKDLVWEKRDFTFHDQLYLFAKQHHRIFNLLGQVDVVVTDCPILLSPVYDAEKRATFEKLVVEEHNKMWTYNVFLKRKKTYNPIGRRHNESEAVTIDRQVLAVLDKHNQCFETFEASQEGKDKIVHQIRLLLAYKNEPAPKGCSCCPPRPIFEKKFGWWE